MLTPIRYWGKYLAPVLLLVIFLYLSIVPQTTNVIKAENKTVTLNKPVYKPPEKVPVEPVNINDWNVKLPAYNMSINVTETDWWRSAAFFKWDLQHRSIDYRCKRFKSVGNWWICLDSGYKIKKPCLVYSFGIGFDFRFDDAMASLGCEVHSFDPSMKMKEHVRNTSVVFHPIGLSHSNSKQFSPRRDNYVRRNTTWPVMNLKTIMDLLGHKGRTIDVLKIDVEGYEWNIIKYLLQENLFQNIKQFMLEYHLFPTWPSKEDYPKLLKIYKSLHDIGLLKFVTAMHPLNLKPKSFNIQADVAYVNILFKSNSGKPIENL
ncbi:uncharacterized protein LOC127730832 [Mytilus californianus]|uniref:uncharacterized protein LOC127730832 n=1 Tax=Mytilus californianus TaxID=6549 RepID=UPI002247AEAF|nr:uncharacterized protein LOC127730832 [Mytilus californianus]